MANRKWWILAAMGAVFGLLLLDETVVGVALPTIKRELGLTQIETHWVVNAYLLLFAGFAAAAGKLGDIIGLKVLFVLGGALFALASLASGLAQDAVWIITARAIQGLGAAVIFPGSLALITNAFPSDQRGMALGIYGSTGATFLSLGPLIGGSLSDLLSWRWIFWINPPIVAIITIIVLTFWIEPKRDEKKTAIDLKGLLTLVGGLGLFVFALMQGPEWGWRVPTVWIPLVLGAVFLTVFVLIESRARQPLIAVGLFRQPDFCAFNLVIFIGQFSKVVMFVFGALYLQDVLNMSALVAGVALLPAVAPTPFIAAPVGKLTDRASSRLLALGGLLATALATLWLALATTWGDYLALVPALIVWAIAQPFLFMPGQRAVMNAVPAGMQGEAGGIAMTSRLLGGVTGMTVSGTLLASTEAYWLVFLTAGWVTAAVLAYAWFAMARQPRVPSIQRPRS
ncbi:MAG: MFS transporter [Hyphomicrobiales bacterium]|nr:MFS transporter [Hyphomicrobiales bacterium]